MLVPVRYVSLPEVQRQLWFAAQVSRNPSGYLVPVQLRIDGPLDLDRLDRAIRAVVTRHEVLRTGTALVGDELVGVVHEVPCPAFGLDEIATDANADADADVTAWLRRHAAEPFELSTEPPFRARLGRVSPELHYLSLTIHHMAFDGWSRNILLRELAEYYAGEDAAPDPLPLPFGAHALAREESGAAHTYAEQLAYWREALAGLVRFELPTDRPRPLHRDGRGAVLRFGIRADTTAALRAVARTCLASLYMVLLAGCQTVLARHSGRDDVTVGSTYSTRDQSELADVVGLFVNMTVLRGDVSGSPTFPELVRRVRETVLDAYEARDVPFVRVVRELEADRDPSRTPLFGILVDLDAGGRVPAQLPGLRVTELPEICLGSKYDLTISFEEVPDGSLTFRIAWDVSLYDESTVQRLGQDIRTSLVEAARYGDRPSDTPTEGRTGPGDPVHR